MAMRMLAVQAHAENEPVTGYGDSAYGTGELHAALRAAGHTAIIKPKPLKPALPVTLDDFIVEEPAATVTCPNGVTRPVTAKRNVTFAAACRGCPLRQRCTTSKTGRSLILHPHDPLLRQARADRAADPQPAPGLRRRPAQVERAIAWIATRRGRRLKLRCHGTTKNHWWLHTRVAGLNLRRLLNLGLTRHSETWALA